MYKLGWRIRMHLKYYDDYLFLCSNKESIYVLLKIKHVYLCSCASVWFKPTNLFHVSPNVFSESTDLFICICSYHPFYGVMQCGAGTFSAAGASACTSCSPGKYLTNASGATDQKSCTTVSTGPHVVSALKFRQQAHTTMTSGVSGIYLTLLFFWLPKF
jgi:hypothetical protein